MLQASFGCCINAYIREVAFGFDFQKISLVHKKEQMSVLRSPGTLQPSWFPWFNEEPVKVGPCDRCHAFQTCS